MSHITAPTPAMPLARPARKWRSPEIVLGLALMALLVGAAAAAPLLATHDPIAQDMLARLKGPSAEHWLGTDNFGRDTFSRILYGLRLSMIVAVASTALAAVLGVAVGILSGFQGGWIDRGLSALNDVLMSIPQLVAGIIIVALLGPGVVNLIIALAVTAFPAFYRMARAEALSLREREYVDACRVLGYSNARIMFRHLLPETQSELLVVATLWMATAVRTEASLSFIGLGAPPPTATLGGLVRAGFDNLLQLPGLTLWPSLAIFVLMIGLNILGDGLRDAADPRSAS
ncbi:ABC transporter permease [Paracoccus sanguinis]|uniref:ABC transporter permease n=1 Tax=Paracoccus sanguinis TaxID=1545044 RepID=UPI001FD0879D|nr:ABC transporter permease [Paracoccus sanguinis]